MRTVIERHGYTVDEQGFIHYQESASTYDAAESIAGRRLDRRRNYAIIDGKVAESRTWTQECSDCEGYGCSECGGKGKVRCGSWVPISATEE